MTEHKIGEPFEHEGVWLEAVGFMGCAKCYFYRNRCREKSLSCSWILRSDGSEVIFRQVDPPPKTYDLTEEDLMYLLQRGAVVALGLETTEQSIAIAREQVEAIIDRNRGTK